jgi:hypothetical protein
MQAAEIRDGTVGGIAKMSAAQSFSHKPEFPQPM